MVRVREENAMKRIGLVILALILTLGSLGLGYSMWSQNVTLKGQVATGSVSLQISDPTFTEAFKNEASTTNLGNIEIYNGDGSDLATWLAANGGANLVLIGSTGPTGTWPVTCAPGSSGISASFTSTNLFPLWPNPAGPEQPWRMDFTLTNVNSIPVIISSAAVTGVPTGTNWGVTTTYQLLTGASGTLVGTQIDPGQSVEVIIGITVPDSAVTENANFTLTDTITAVQWNEYNPAR
jgi:hypothetical protein